MRLVFLRYFIFCFILTVGCNSDNSQSDGVIARFNDKKLYLSDMKGLLSEGISKSDSDFIIQNYAEKWLKDQVMLSEALGSNSIDLTEVESKVLEYKNALILYEYQKSIIKQKLDTLITEKDYKDFYEKHYKDFELKQNIVKGALVKVKGKPNGLIRLNKELFYEKDCEKVAKHITSYGNQYAEYATVSVDRWVTFDELVKATPFNRIENKTDWLSKNNWGVLEEDGNSFYLKVCECKLENRISPFEYIKEQIKSIILNARKVKLLEEYQEEIYKRALSEKEVEKFN